MHVVIRSSSSVINVSSREQRPLVEPVKSARAICRASISIPIPERVQFKIAVLNKFWRTGGRHATSFLSLALMICLAADLSALSTLTVWLCLESSYQLSAAEHFRLSAHRSGTTCRRTWRLLSRCLHFVGGSKRISSQNHFLIVSWTLTNPSLVDL